jgi:hypothetical protein
MNSAYIQYDKDLHELGPGFRVRKAGNWYTCDIHDPVPRMHWVEWVSAVVSISDTGLKIIYDKHNQYSNLTEKELVWLILSTT